jgi:hypothetical protein
VSPGRTPGGETVVLRRGESWFLLGRLLFVWMGDRCLTLWVNGGVVAVGE